MAVTLVQATVSGEGSTINNQSTFGSTTTTGNAIIVGIQLYAQDGATNEIDMAASSAVTDTGGNTFNPIASAEIKGNGLTYYQHIYMYAAYNIVGHASDTVLCTFARSCWSFFTAWELTPCQFDRASTASNPNTTSISAGTMTPSANGAFGVQLVTEDWGSNPGGTTFNHDTGWADDYNQTAGNGQTYTAHYPQTTAASLAFHVSSNATGVSTNSLASGAWFVPPSSATQTVPTGVLLGVSNLGSLSI